MNKVIIFLLFFSAKAQIIYEYSDSTKSDYRETERIDLLYKKSVYLPVNAQDSVPVLPFASGSNQISIGYNFIFSPKLKLALREGIQFYKLSFQQTEKKRFPSYGDSVYVAEKIRAGYINSAVLWIFVLKRNPKNKKVISQIEVGGDFGFLFVSDMKYKQKQENKKRPVTLKVPQVEGINKFRYGLILNFKYKWLGGFAYYRLSRVFSEEKKPSFSPFELGFFVAL